MSRFFALCKANHKKHGLKDQTIDFTKRRQPINFCFAASLLLIILIVVGFGFNLFQLTSTSTTGFKISEMKEELKNFKLSNENLKAQTDDFERLEFIKKEAEKIGLVPVGQVEYLEISKANMAVAK